MIELAALGTVLIVIIFLIQVRSNAIKAFKIEYYEGKLRNRGVDISSVENIGLIDIFKI